MSKSKPKLLLLYTRPGAEERSQKIKADAQLKGWTVLTKQPSKISQLRLALFHKGDEDDWEEVAKGLLKRHPNLPVIAFSGADQAERALQSINDHTVLSLGTGLLVANLNDILDYCKARSKKGISIDALNDAIGNIPWRYEYFIDLSLRLLSFNSETRLVVKKIVGIDENGQMIEGEYEKRTTLSCSENELFVRIKLALLQLLEEHEKVVSAASDSESSDSYSTIHNLLYDLAESQRKPLEDGIGR